MAQEEGGEVIDDLWPAPQALFVVGDVLEALRKLPDASVDLVLTSPPFLALRSYLPPGHPDKDKEIGGEQTPGAYIDVLLDVIEECRRVLAPHGSIAFELGDTYAGSGGSGGDFNPGGMREGIARYQGTARSAREASARIPWRTNDQDEAERNGRFDGRASKDFGTGSAERPARNRVGSGWPLDKSLCLVPELLRIALVYGFNPLTGRETPRWRARNVVRWCRPNPAVGALADKVRPATSDIVIACVGRHRYFDLDAIRKVNERADERYVGRRRSHDGDVNRPDEGASPQNEEGAPPLDHWWFDEDVFEQDAWLVSTAPYRGSHYATWPADLLALPIKAMCPVRVCTVCGKPSERISEIRYEANRSTNGPQSIERKRLDGGSAGFLVRADRVAVDAGWTDCGHHAWRSGIVLDPFAGSGTTLAVATGHGRSALGIDLDERNLVLARERVGMFLQEEKAWDS